MNRINPLYVLLFFVVFALLMAWMDSQKREQGQVLLREISQMQQEGESIASLKSKWKDEKADLKKLERIIKRVSVKGDDIKTKKEKGIYRAEISMLSGFQAEKLINSLLNDTLNLESLTLERLGDNNVSLVLECQI